MSLEDSITCKMEQYKLNLQYFGKKDKDIEVLYIE